MCRLEKLTDEELVERIRAGETSCMDTLIERYKRQVRNQARTLYLIGGDSDDLIQEGMLGLFKAIRDYRPEKEVSFEAFAKLCISRQLYSAVQAAGRQKHVPLNTYVELSDQLDAQDDGPQQAEGLEHVCPYQRPHAAAEGVEVDYEHGQGHIEPERDAERREEHQLQHGCREVHLDSAAEDFREQEERGRGMVAPGSETLLHIAVQAVHASAVVERQQHISYDRIAGDEAEGHLKV